MPSLQVVRTSPQLIRAAKETRAERILQRQAEGKSLTNQPPYDFEADPLVWDGKKYVPLHEGQLEGWTSIRRFVALFCGWRSGKTELGPPWLMREIQRNGPGDYAVIAPTYPILDNKARPALRRFIVRTIGKEAYHSSGDIWTLTQAGCKAVFGHVPDIETRILFRHGSNADAIEAFDGKGIWADEPGQMDDDLHEAMEVRVSIGGHRILYTSRPFKFNWYVTKIWSAVMDAMHKRRADAPEDTEVVNFSSLANPNFSRAEWDRMQAKMPAWAFDLKFRGIPTKPAGAIYGCFEKRDCLRRIPLRDEWQRAAGHDFGNKNMAGLWAFKHPTLLSTEGKPAWVVYSSYLQGDEPVEVHAQRFLYGYSPLTADETPKSRPPDKWRCAKRQADAGWEPVPPWAWGGNLTSEHGWREAFALSGYPIVEPPIGEVDVGIETVFAMIRTGELLFFDDLVAVIADLLAYAYTVDDEGNVVLDAAGRPVIDQKSKWHRMDCLRSLAVGLSGGAGEPVSIGARDARKQREEQDDDPGAEIDLRELYDEGGAKPSRVGHGRLARGLGKVARPQRASHRNVRSSVG